MKLLRNQVETFKSVRTELEDRGIVLLTGASNGKTAILHQTLEVLGKRNKAGDVVTRASHAENPKVEIVTRFHWQRSDKLTLVSMMRQFIELVTGNRPPNSQPEVVKTFEGLLRSAANRNVCYGLALDNFEEAPQKATTFLHALNEYYDHEDGRCVGLALLIAGNYMKLARKLPLSFQQRLTEIPITLLSENDIRQLIEVLCPINFGLWDDAAIKVLARSATNLAMAHTIRRTMQQVKEYRYSTVPSDLVQEMQEEAGKIARIAKAA